MNGSEEKNKDAENRVKKFEQEIDKKIRESSPGDYEKHIFGSDASGI